jgi:predicted transcriptional regulator
LRKALQELVDVGFLKGWKEELKEGERVYVLDRPDITTFRALTNIALSDLPL